MSSVYEVEEGPCVGADGCVLPGTGPSSAVPLLLWKTIRVSLKIKLEIRKLENGLRLNRGSSHI